MAKAAAALTSATDLSLGGRREPDRELQSQLNTLGRQLGYGRRFRPGRSQLGLVLLIVIGVWLVFTFGQVLTQQNDANASAAALAADGAALAARLEAARQELDLVQTDSFQRIQARAYGMGETGEQVFALEAGAPSAPPIIPLGGTPDSVSSGSPLEAWLSLLFGD